ncbi:MAG: potassium channel family protein [Dehalococcoidia bacterium]
MSLAILVGGMVLVTLAVFDQVMTVVAVGGGGGPFTSRITSGLWRLSLGIHHRVHKHGLLQAMGIAVTLSILALWFVALWLGWTLIFAAGDMAVVDSLTGEPADGWTRLYYAGYTLFTMGNGDYRPDGAGWQVATVLANATGLALVTLAISYLVPVIQAAVHRRSVAATIAAVGGTPEGIINRAWNGSDLSAIEQHAVSLTSDIGLINQRHLAYPVLHYFHDNDPRSAFAPRLAALDDALSIASEMVAPDQSRESS